MSSVLHKQNVHMRRICEDFFLPRKLPCHSVSTHNLQVLLDSMVVSVLFCFHTSCLFFVCVRVGVCGGTVARASANSVQCTLFAFDRFTN